MLSPARASTYAESMSVERYVSGTFVWIYAESINWVVKAESINASVIPYPEIVVGLPDSELNAPSKSWDVNASVPVLTGKVITAELPAECGCACNVWACALFTSH